MKLEFLIKNKGFLLFGLILTLFSTFGQTSFLSVFTPHLQEHFQLSYGQIGLVYSLATLLSAICMALTGNWIDKVDLRRFTLIVSGLLVLACSLMAISTTLVLLFVGYFFLRFACQGLMTHTSMVSMARYFEEERGRAISIAAIGGPIGDSFLPIGIALLLGSRGFHSVWWMLAAFSAFAITPILRFCLKGHDVRHQKYLERKEEEVVSFTPKRVLKDWKFYFVSSGVLAPAFIATGVFFQNSVLLASKGWPLYIYAASLINYSIGNVVGSFLAGYLVDKYKATKILGYYLFPLLAGLAILYGASPLWALYAFMLGAGLSQGSSSVLVAAVWAELYGSKFLGTIRSWISALKVLVTAVSPVLFGMLIDRDVPFSSLTMGCTIYTLLSIASLGLVSYRHSKQIVEPLGEGGMSEDRLP